MGKRIASCVTIQSRSSLYTGNGVERRVKHLPRWTTTRRQLQHLLLGKRGRIRYTVGGAISEAGCERLPYPDEAAFRSGYAAIPTSKYSSTSPGSYWIRRGGRQITTICDNDERGWNETLTLMDDHTSPICCREYFAVARGNSSRASVTFFQPNRHVRPSHRWWLRSLNYPAIFSRSARTLSWWRFASVTWPFRKGQPLLRLQNRGLDP